MSWRDHIRAMLGDKPPVNSAALATEIKPLLYNMRDALNLLLGQKMYYRQHATVGVNTGSGNWEEWDATLSMNVTVERNRMYLVFFNICAEYSMGGVAASWQIYDSTTPASIVAKSVVVHGMPESRIMTVMALWIPASTGIKTLQVRSMSVNAINPTPNCYDLFMVLQVPFGDG